MAEHSAQERTEDATPKRKLDARKQGRAPRSQELVSALTLCSLLLVMGPILSGVSNQFVRSIRSLPKELPSDVGFASLQRFVADVCQGPVLAFAPLLLVALAVGVAGNFLQVGFLLSAEPLKPKFEKLNPLTGLKRIFSKHAGMESVKASAKTLVFGSLAFTAIQDRSNEFAGISYANPDAAVKLTGDLMQTIGMRIGAAWLVLAGLDYFFQRRMWTESLKMTKDEVKQEFKETEQSPELKAAMARRRRKLSQGRGLKAVREASVVVTNPTHFAVAIRYEVGEMHAPQVVAKGVDFLAAKIREEATAANIPIIENKPLARQLYRQCEVGDFVPRELFQAVAEVLAFVYRTIRPNR